MDLLTDEEVASLTQSILTRYGIDFTCYEPKSLKRRISRLMTMYNFNSAHELWIRLLHERDFIQNFMNEVSVGMTSMFRDPVLWKHIKKLGQTEWKTKQELSIWHAGCSTGEEVYTMGIILKELNLSNRVKAQATDINLQAIETAKKGEYHKIKMIENERNYKEYNPIPDFYRYSGKVDDKYYKLNSDLTSHVNYSYHNLINDDFKGMYDIIFCRNVMIYFDNIAKKKLIEKFYNALKPGGHFVIGFYDTMIPIIDKSLLTLENEEAKIFKKKI